MMTDTERERKGHFDQLTVVVSVDRGTGAATVLTVEGEVDMQTTPVLRRRIGEAFNGDPTHLIVDLSGVEFIGSHGLAALLDAQERAGVEGRGLAVVAGTRAARRPIEISGLAQVLNLCDDLDQAQAAVPSARRPG
ncbi:MAG: STAS domain-containing protein [Pseudonocardia sp.]